MNSFISQKNKLKILFDNNQKSQQTLSNQTKLQKNIQINEQNQNIKYDLKKLKNLSFDWEDCNYSNEGTDNEDLRKQYKVWTIEWNEFDIRLLAYIDIKFLYHQSTGTIQDTLNITPVTGYHFYVQDIANETYLKKVTLKAGLYINISSLIEPVLYQAKLNVLFINPRDY